MFNGVMASAMLQSKCQTLQRKRLAAKSLLEHLPSRLPEPKAEDEDIRTVEGANAGPSGSLKAPLTS